MRNRPNWNVVKKPQGKPIVGTAGWARSLEDLYERRDWISPTQTPEELAACYQRRLRALEAEAEAGVLLYQPSQLAADLFGFPVARRTVANWCHHIPIRLPTVRGNGQGKFLTTMRCFTEWLSMRPVHHIRNAIREQLKELDAQQGGGK